MFDGSFHTFLITVHNAKLCMDKQHYFHSLIKQTTTCLLPCCILIGILYIGNRSRKKMLVDFASLGAFANIFLYYFLLITKKLNWITKFANVFSWTPRHIMKVFCRERFPIYSILLSITRVLFLGFVSSRLVRSKQQLLKYAWPYTLY